MQPAWYTPFSHFVSGLVTRSLDYALPLRCPACGEIVDEEGGFCAPCWSSLPFIADPLCACCGEPLPALAEQGALCGQCLADPPRYDRVRAVAWHDGAARVIVHRLKYGRRIGHARIMARHMARLLPDGARDAMLVPVPLHRWRIWSRGFNQAALIARALAQRTGVEARLDIIRRVRRTPPLHPLGRSARERALRGAFALAPGAAELICGRPVILIDDVWTTGATATGCAQLLADAGAARIDILCWARTGENPLD